MKYVRILFIIFITTYYSVSYAQIPDFILKQRKAVVTIYYNDKGGNKITGTCFIIDSNGTIATNYHVISSSLDSNE